MTNHYRVCGLGICEPSTVVLGVRYGVCPLKNECDPARLCGYLAARREIEIEAALATTFSPAVGKSET